MQTALERQLRGRSTAKELLSLRLWLDLSRIWVALNILVQNADVIHTGDQDLSRITDSLKTLPTSGRATVIHNGARPMQIPVSRRCPISITVVGCPKFRGLNRICSIGISLLVSFLAAL